MKKIEEKRLLELLKSEELLNNLQAYGADNWQGYYSWEDEDELTKEEWEEYIKSNFEDAGE